MPAGGGVEEAASSLASRPVKLGTASAALLQVLGGRASVYRVWGCSRGVLLSHPLLLLLPLMPHGSYASRCSPSPSPPFPAAASDAAWHIRLPLGRGADGTFLAPPPPCF